MTRSGSTCRKFHDLAPSGVVASCSTHDKKALLDAVSAPGAAAGSVSSMTK
eukprot:CAMPEP_0172733356 /NCGR_PEP_ID=MMETSP1074-20121228/106944_1 /TAXON_ID=2916 /ORGANISM="Ceratium fusus, Strain PA161109" /LENGTH=50 /DNA_ID=CAMNT_0013561889 /DNA_START=267 /DNA_END=416 /DNA_ORIENTATION=-